MSNKAQIREDAKKLNPIDDALFMVMAEEKSFCQEILRIILSDNALVVVRHISQKPLKNLQGRSCVLDLECILGSGKRVGVEVQKVDNDDHQRRIRYDGALLTTNIVEPGSKFQEVPDVIMVFISEFDIFAGGYPLYHVDRVIRELNRRTDNGFQEIYVNATVDDDSDVARLMKVFNDDEAYDDEKFPATSGCKRRFKTTEEGVSRMCGIIEKYRNEGRAEGRAEGHAEGRAEGRAEGLTEGSMNTLMALVKKNILSIKDAAEQAGMTETAFKKMAML